MTQGMLPPGPKGVAIFGNYFQFKKYNMLEFANIATRTYGDIVHIKLGPKHVIIFSNPKDVDHILKNLENKYDKALSKDIELIASNSLNTLGTNDEWAEKSNVFTSSLDKISLAEHEAVLNELLDELFDRWDTNTQKDQNISLDMLTLTVSIIAKLMLHINPHNLNISEINKYKYTIVVKAINRTTQLLKKPVATDTKLSDAIRFKHLLIKNIVEEYLKNPDPDSYLGKIIAKYKIKKITLPMAKKITGEVMNALYLGSDPSDKLLSWVFYYLSMYPHEKQKLFDEINAVTKTKEITLNNVRAFPVASRFISEVLRLRTPYALIARESLEEDTIRGYHIPKDTICFISPLLVHKHKDYWENPEAFIPDRFITTPIENNPAYIPFSGGSRPCLGQTFAYRQSLYIILKILQKYDFKLAPYYDYNIKFLGVLGSQNDIQGIVEKRKTT